MLTIVHSSSQRARSIGVLHGCTLEVVPGDLWRATADLVVVGIHTQEPAPAALAGLERALSGGLGTLREAGVLSGNLGETLLLSRPPTPIRAGAVLILGLGVSPSATAETVRRAVHAAATQATRMQVAHVASGCGSDGKATPETLLQHLQATIVGIEDVLRTSAGSLRRWSFLFEVDDVAIIVDRFKVAFERATIAGIGESG